MKVIVDSACDITQDEAKELGITVLPLKYYIGEQEYLDGVTVSNHEFYEILEKGDIFPKTTQINPARYMEAFEESLEEDNEVLCMTMSKEISGCYQSALIAREDFDGKVKVLDSEHFCISYRNLAVYRAQLSREGVGLNEAIEKIIDARKRLIIIAVFSTLEYLYKGGRLSRTKSIIGNMLGIKPVISITDGAVNVLKLARGQKKGCRDMFRYIKEKGKIDFSMPYSTGYTGSSPEKLENFLKEYRLDFLGTKSVVEASVGTTVGIYAGPDAIAFSCFMEDEVEKDIKK